MTVEPTLTATPTLRERATAAHAERLQEDWVARAQEHIRYATYLKAALWEVLGVHADPTGPEIEIDGMRFWMGDRSGALLYVQSCPVCGRDQTARVSCLADLGDLLDTFTEDRDHYCEPPAPPITESDDVADRLLVALRAFVANEMTREPY